MTMRIHALLPNGTADWSDDVIDGGNFAIEIARDTDTNTVVKTLSSELTLKGQAYNDVFNVFHRDLVAGCGAVLSVRVHPECCNASYTLELRADGVAIDQEECTAEVTLRAASSNQKAFECLRAQPFWYSRDGANADAFDNAATDFTREFPPARLRYERNAKDAYFALNMTFIGMAISLFISAASSLPNVVELGVQAALGVVFLAITPTLTLIAKFRRRYHFAFYLHDIFAYNCERCGLAFSSTPLQGIYRSAALLPIANTRGVKRNDGAAFVEANAPNINVIELADQLAPVFNAQYQIQNDTFFFGRTEGVPQGTVIEVANTEEPPVYRVDFSEYPRVRILEYTTDPIDDEANNVKHVFDTVREIDGDCRTGVDRVVFPFSVIRTTRDGFDDLADLDDIKNETRREIIARAGDREADREVAQDDVGDGNALKITKDTAAVPKLVMLDDKVGGDRVVADMANFFADVLYDRFYADADKLLPVTVSDVAFFPDDFCKVVSVLERESLNVRWQTPYGLASPDNILIEFADGRVTFGANTILA